MNRFEVEDRLWPEVVDYLRDLGITVHDHVIIGRQGHASLKALGLI